MIDTHCHLTYEGLHERIDEVVAAAEGAGVDRMISVGTSPGDARMAVTLAGQYEGIFATVGLHPLHAQECADRAALQAAIRALVGYPKVVALGEMGLDRHYGDPPFEQQQQVFSWQLELAAELSAAGRNWPMIIHNRKATDDVLAMIASSGLPAWRFVFHCFTGSAEEVEAILAAGAMVSFTGIVTFKNSADLAAASDRVPLNRLMIETDSPYLTPEPFRKIRPNEPRYVSDVARFLAQRRGIDLNDFVAAVDANAERFFRLPAHAS
jgi:TatD DNase family protein